MTVKLNLTISEEVVAKSKSYAAKRKTSVSKLVEELLNREIATMEKSPKKKSFVEQWGGTLTGHLTDEKIKQIKDEHLTRKYGY